jgi:CO/xanthine dehydrogenase Mo-binding subunit
VHLTLLKLLVIQNVSYSNPLLLHHLTEDHAPVSEPVAKVGGTRQASGEATYTGDISVKPGTLYAVYVQSTRAKAFLKGIDAAEALKMEGVVRVIVAADLPGIN